MLFFLLNVLSLILVLLNKKLPMNPLVILHVNPTTFIIILFLAVHCIHFLNVCSPQTCTDDAAGPRFRVQQLGGHGACTCVHARVRACACARVRVCGPNNTCYIILLKVLKYPSVLHHEDCENSLNNKERCLNASFITHNALRRHRLKGLIISTWRPISSVTRSLVRLLVRNELNPLQREQRLLPVDTSRPLYVSGHVMWAEQCGRGLTPRILRQINAVCRSVFITPENHANVRNTSERHSSLSFFHVNKARYLHGDTEQTFEMTSMYMLGLALAITMYASCQRREEGVAMLFNTLRASYNCLMVFVRLHLSSVCLY